MAPVVRNGSARSAAGVWGEPPVRTCASEFPSVCRGRRERVEDAREDSGLFAARTLLMTPSWRLDPLPPRESLGSEDGVGAVVDGR